MRRLGLALTLVLAALVAGAGTVQAADQGGRDIFSWGNDVYVSQEQTVARDVTCFRCNIHIAGTVGRDVFAFGGDVYLDGSVGRDATAVGGNLHLGAGSSVERDATAVGGSLDRSPRARVGRNAVAGGAFPAHPGHWTASAVFSPWQALPGLVLLGIAMLLALAAPRQLALSGSLLDSRPLEAGGLGCLAMIAAVVVTVAFAITVILIPLALALWLVVAGAWIFGWAVVMAWAGRRLLAISDPAQATAPTSTAQVLVGGLVIAAVALVPVIGEILYLLGGTLAVGVALGTRFGTRTEGAPFYGWMPTRQPVTPPPPPPA